MPIFHKIQNNQLLLRDIKLNEGVIKGLLGCMMMNKNLIERLFLDNNCLDGDEMAQILTGVNNQLPFKSLTITGNNFNEACAELVLQLLKRKIPENLEELHLIYAKCVWRATDLLVKNMTGKNYLRKLSLVSVGFNEESFYALIEVVKKTKTLTYLDISWNQLVPAHFQELLPIIYKNKRLMNINLSWNSIIDTTPSEETEEFVLYYLEKIIKQNKAMQHMDLSGTGLGKKMVHALGAALRRSRAVCSIHLSGNPGAEENRDYLQERIHCRKDEDMDRFFRI